MQAGGIFFTKHLHRLACLQEEPFFGETASNEVLHSCFCPLPNSVTLLLAFQALLFPPCILELTAERPSATPKCAEGCKVPSSGFHPSPFPQGVFPTEIQGLAKRKATHMAETKA